MGATAHGGRVLGAWAGGLPRTFWSLWIGTLINRVGTFVEPFLALYLTTGRHLSLPGAGALVAATGAGSIVSQPLGGALADRIGRRPTLCGGMVASGAAITLLALSHAVWLLAVAAVLVGVTGNVYRPAAQATIADIVPVADRRRATGLIFWAVNLGFSAAAVAGGLLAAGGYGLLFAVDAITCTLCAVVVWRTVPETRPAAARHADAPGWGRVVRDRVAMTYFGLNLGVAAVYATTFTILPLAMYADGHPAPVYGAVIAVNGIGIVVLHPLLATSLLALRPAVVLALGAALTAVAMAVIAVSDGLLGYVLAIVFVTLGEICNATTGPGLIGEIAPAALRGRYAGAYGLSWGLAFTITPLAGGALLGGGRAAAPWVAAAVLSLAVGVALLALGPAIEARRQSVAADA
jgi:MFS family permease